MIQRSNPPGLKSGRWRTCWRDRECRNYFCRLNLLYILCKGLIRMNVRGEGVENFFLFPSICFESFEDGHSDDFSNCRTLDAIMSEDDHL